MNEKTTAARPNFFIIGGPKCGTTALSEYLRTNPHIYFCDPKEPHYFNDDFLDRYIENETDYLNYFQGASTKHTAIGEGSVQYLYSKTAVKNILDFNPDAKFIVMLRKPYEVAYSWHAQTLISHGEDITDFKKAWDLRHERRLGNHLPFNTKEKKVFIYSDIAKFGEQLERLYSVVKNKKNIKIIFFDDFRTDTLSVYKETLQFLDVEYDGKTDFPVINESKKHRSQLFEKIRTYIIYLKNKYNIKIRTGLLSYLKKKNTKKTPRNKLPVDFQNKLAKYYSDDIAILEALTKRDLSSWKI